MEKTSGRWLEYFSSSRTILMDVPAILTQHKQKHVEFHNLPHIRVIFTLQWYSSPQENSNQRKEEGFVLC